MAVIKARIKINIKVPVACKTPLDLKSIEQDYTNKLNELLAHGGEEVKMPLYTDSSLAEGKKVLPTGKEPLQKSDILTLHTQLPANKQVLSPAIKVPYNIAESISLKELQDFNKQVKPKELLTAELTLYDIVVALNIHTQYNIKLDKEIINNIAQWYKYTNGPRFDISNIVDKHFNGDTLVKENAIEALKKLMTLEHKKKVL